MNDSCEKSFNLICQIQSEIIRLKNKAEEAEKKNLDYEMELFKKNKDNEYLNKALESYKLKIRESELKIYELELKLREKNMNDVSKKKKPKNNSNGDHWTYYMDR